MTYAIDITNLDGTVNSPKSIHEVGLELGHTELHMATSILSATAFDPVDSALADIDIDLDGAALFRGEIVRVAEDSPRPGLYTVESVGPGYDLTRNTPASTVTYTNERRIDAIDDYLANHTDGVTVDATTHVPTTTVKDDDLKEADTTTFTNFSDLFTPTASDMVVQDGTGIQAAQTVFAAPVDGLTNVNATRTADTSGDSYFHIDSEYLTISQGGSGGGEISLTINPDYTIPQERVGVRMHGELSGSGDVADSSVTFNGQELAQAVQFTGPDPVSGDIAWSVDLADGVYTNGDLTEGNNYVLTLDLAANSSNSLEYEIDMMVVYDTANGPTVWDEPTAFNDDIDGPELFPSDQQIVFDEDYVNTWNITDGRIESQFNDTSNGQQLSLSNDGGANYLSSANTETLTADFDGNDLWGNVLQPRITLSGYGSNSWLTTRANGQKLTEFKAFVTTDTTDVIAEMTLDKNHFRNLQTLHAGGFRFVIDPRVRSPVTIESFLDGDTGSTKTDDWRVLDDGTRRVRGVKGYANQIRLTYTSETTGNEATATVKDDDEIAAKSNTTIERQVITTEELGGNEAVVRARTELLEAIAVDEISGSQQAWAAFILPGYTYTVDEFGQDTSLERVNYTESTGQARMSLDFTEAQDVPQQAIVNQRQIRDLQ